MPSIAQFKLMLIVLTTMTCATGCALQREVRPWQKEFLAQPEMALSPDPLQTAHHEHVYFSRESGTGGHSVGGGGCGCN